MQFLVSCQKSTYVVNEEGVTRAGEHSDRYTYFTMKHEYKKYLIFPVIFIPLLQFNLPK